MAVATTFKIMPESPSADITEIERAVKEKLDVKDSRIEPLAFGMKVLKVLVVTEDTGTQDAENIIKSIEGVGEVEVESQTLL
ncbi:MAG: elongation factor 1-beta [Candidatus Micrarchaeota archaeon]|nr:elongation factor 1-beta [Candidatus Micrarchaeota archaeon]